MSNVDDTIQKDIQIPIQIEQLPRETLFTVFSYLEAADLARIFQTNRALKEIAEDPLLWKSLLQKEKWFKLANRKSPHIRYRYRKLVRFRVKKIWETAMIWLERAQVRYLNPPTTDLDIDAAEDELQLVFPEEFRAFLLIHNGQQPGYLGLLAGAQMLSLAEIVLDIKKKKQDKDIWMLQEGCIPVSSSLGFQQWCIKTGEPGAVCLMSGWNLFTKADSWAELLRSFIRR